MFGIRHICAGEYRMKIDKKAINYYYSFFEVSKELSQKQFYEFNMAIYKVMFFEVHIDSIEFTDTMLTILWKSVKHSIQASVKGYCDKKSIPYDEVFTPLGNPLANNIKDKNNEQVQEKGQVQVVTPLESLRDKVVLKLEDYPTINKEAFKEWWSYKKYKTIAPITKTLNFLSNYDFNIQQEIVDKSIMNNYAGLFEPKRQKANRTDNNVDVAKQWLYENDTQDLEVIGS